MPQDIFWKGYLKLSLVSAAVSLTPATTQGGKVRFHVLNRLTGNRVESRYVDSVTHKPVAEKNQVKGFARAEGDFVLLEDDEIAAVGLESTRIIDITTFIPAGSIDWIWYDRPHFLRPEDKIGAEAFGVIRQAMRATNVVGIARLVLYRRERAVLLEPRGKGIVLWTLHYGEEMRENIEMLDPQVTLDPPLLAAMRKMIDARMTAWKPSLVADPIQKKLKALLKSKQPRSPPAKGEGKRRTGGGKIVNIMDALKKSLAAD